MSSIFDDALESILETEIGIDATIYQSTNSPPRKIRIAWINPDEPAQLGQVGAKRRTRIVESRAALFPTPPREGDVVVISGEQFQVEAVSQPDPDRLLYRMDLIRGPGPQA